jgi:hypothetical protein
MERFLSKGNPTFGWQYLTWTALSQLSNRPALKAFHFLFLEDTHNGRGLQRPSVANRKADGTDTPNSAALLCNVPQKTGIATELPCLPINEPKSRYDYGYELTSIV